MSVASPIDASDEILLSGDGHVAEPVDLWETRLPEKFRDRRRRFPNIKYGEAQPRRVGGRDPIERLKDMAIDGMSAEVLYPTLGVTTLYTDPRARSEEACASVYNDWMAEYCSVAPTVSGARR